MGLAGFEPATSQYPLFGKNIDKKPKPGTLSRLDYRPFTYVI